MKPEIKEKLLKIKADAEAKVAECTLLKDLIDVKNIYLSKKSELSSMMSMMKNLDPEERKEFGQLVNDTRKAMETAFDEKMKVLTAAEMDLKLKSETIDISLPSESHAQGHINPFALISDEIMDIFVDMGYEVTESRDVELDKYNFELLNIPQDHPARDMQDSFYITDNLLMRTQTSAAQAHTMEEKAGKPIRIICPGKCYRRDDDDMTHSHQFGQIEGLVIDKNINIGHLKATLDLFAKRMFGEKREIRLRSSYFPFTEPSVEVDVSCAECGGKGCSMCKGTGWIEILGAGMVHPNVLKLNGYDPEVYSGFAFGIGIERVAMLRYGIDDIRRLYQNDMRFISQFERK